MVIKGNEEGLDPVAIIIFFPSIVSDFPSDLVILTCVALSNEPNPS